MRRRVVALGLGIVIVIAFAFFVPVVYMTSYPVFCTSYGHHCVGAWLPLTGSITFWMFGYGGTLLMGAYYVTWP